MENNNKKPEHRYEVHHYTLCEGWVNCWTVTDNENSEYPDSYSTIEAAQAEINELLSDIQSEIDRGERHAGEGYDAEEYQIYDNIEKEYVV
ncbi:MAG TPA: hypothetical protein ENI77_05245 [Nitrospirae bacterium]|nr:hypothetical protein [Nitrospirota bacterium]